MRCALSLMLLMAISFGGNTTGNDIDMEESLAEECYQFIIRHLALTKLDSAYDPKFAQNLKNIHTIVPSGFIMWKMNQREFVIFSTRDWSRESATGTVYCGDTLGKCLMTYARRFASSSVLGINLSSLKKSSLWGDLCIVDSSFDEQTRSYHDTHSRRIELFRNGIWVSLRIGDDSMTSYPQFFDALDALLRHNPDKPFVPPVDFSENEYQETLKKYLAWRAAKCERELAKLRAEAARPRPPARPQQPFFVWTDEIAAPGKELMRKWFPDSPEELGTWRGGYAAAPDNPLSQRVTAESLRGRFPIVSPLSPRYGRGDAFHVCLSSRDGKERCAVAVLHARSAAEAREALAWLCLTGGDCGGLRKIGGEPVRFKKRPSLAIGDFCVSNQGEVREDGTVAPGSDEREIYFLRGNTAAMVRALPPAPGAGAGAAPGGSAVATAKRLDGIIKEALAAGQ